MRTLLNQCQFIGNLGQDAEMKMLPSGTAVVSFSLAVTDKRHNKDTKTTEYDTLWVNNFSFYGSRAEAAFGLFKKGSKLFVSSHFVPRKYEKADGTMAYSYEFVVDDFELLRLAKDGEEDAGTGEPVIAEEVELPF